MSINCSYKDVRWCNVSFHKSDECICDANLIVPDSKCDIAKIISVKAFPSISETKSEQGRILVSGQVKFNVLYIGEDENTKICSITTLSPFSHVINAPSVTDDCITLSSIDYFNCSHSIINSRRLKVTSRLKLSASAYSNHQTKVLTEADLAQVKSIDFPADAAKVICSKNIIVTANADLPGSKGAISEILRYSTKILDSDFKILNNKVIIKGTASASVLYLSDNNISDASVSIPFTEVVEAEGLNPSLDCKVKITIADCEILPDTDLSGEYKMLDVNLIFNVTITAFSHENIHAVTDIYIPRKSVRTETFKITSGNIIDECTEEEFLKEALTLPDKYPQISKILDVDCILNDFSFSEDKVLCTADITASYLSDDTSSPINSYSAKIPVSHKINVKNPTNIKGEIGHISYSILSDKSIDLRISVAFSLSKNDKTDFSVYTNIEEAEYTPQKRSSIIVSFVNKGDTLWDIAKKHNISVSDLANANALDENAPLTVGDKLIIPR